MEKNSKAVTNLNAKILAFTITISTSHPELMKYIDEMPVTIPNEKHPNIELESLNNYYNSLTTLLHKYLQVHSANATYL